MTESPPAARVLVAAACLLAGACGPAPGDGDTTGEAAGADEASAADSVHRASVVKAVRGFKESLADGDSAGALARLHPDAVIHESGHAESRSQYRAGHLGADMEFHAATEVETTREEVVLGGDQALYLSEYRMTGTPGGDTLRLRGVETMVLVPVDGKGASSGGWRIRHIHWSSREAKRE